MRLWRAERFEIAATDPLGRALWQLEVSGGRGRIRDRREGGVCGFDSATSPGTPGFEVPLAAAQLPAVLAGRLPLGRDLLPAQATTPGERLEASDGSVWRWRREGDELVEWSLARSGRELLAWSGSGRSGRLVAAGEQLEVSWSEGAGGALRSAEPAWPAAIEGETECASAAIP